MREREGERRLQKSRGREREWQGGSGMELGKVREGIIDRESQTSALTKSEDVLYKGVK